MPSLLELPLELLNQILKETIPVGFEAAALSCQTLYAASAPFRAQYATTRKRFRHFRFSKKDDDLSDSEDCWDKITQETGIQITTTRELLEYIALDHSVIPYIQSIDLRDHVDLEDDEDLSASLEAEVSEPLQKLVLASPFIEAFKGDPDDWVRLIRRSGIYADVFLLTLLSHVRTLNMHPRWEEVDPLYGGDNLVYKRLWPVLDMITYRANNVEEFLDAPLSKLSALGPSREYGYDERSPLTPFVPFLAINSVTEVSLRSCLFIQDGYTGIEFDPMVERYSTNLRKLILDSCVGGAKELSQLLSRIPNLEIFEYCHETKWHGCGYFWNVGVLLATVQDICAKTLKELSVTTFEMDGDSGSTLMDMTNFLKLAVLELEIDVLCNPPYDPSMKDSQCDDGVAGNPAWPKLCEMLPTTIERLNLCLSTFRESHLECITHLIEDFSDARPAKLPHLKNLSISVRMDFVPTIPDHALEILNAAKRSGFSILKLGTSISLL
jgi:hypothetical protein